MIKRSSLIFNRRGFTLIEVLISSTILLVTVIAIFLIIANGSALNRKQLLWRRACNELERIFESPQYSYKNYLNITPIPPGTRTVILDDRGNADTDDDLVADVWVTVVNETYSHGAITNIPTKRVTAFISWNDEGKSVTDSLENIITLVTIH